MRPRWLCRAGWLAPAFLFVILPLSGQCAPAPSEPQLGAEIEAIFAADIRSGGPSDTQHVRIRRIFAEHGVPTDEMVGERAAEEYVILLSGEPSAFLEAVLPHLAQAADAGKVSENNYIYLHAQARQKKIREKFSGPPANPALQREIERLLKTDQAVRSPGNHRWDLQKLAATDRADGVEVRAILAKYGLPTFAQVGVQAAKDFDVVIQHQPLALQKQVLPQMKVDAGAGQVNAESYAMLLDRVESNSGQPQTYGENFVCTPDGKVAPSPIADPERVDRRRAEMGLMSLALYGRLLGELYMSNLCAQVAAANRKAGAQKPSAPHP